MSTRWWIREGAGLVDDDGRVAVPSDALHATESLAGAESWIELPCTRWGRRHRDLNARANFEHLEKLYPCVQRVLAVREQWRCLIVRDVDLWRLDDVIGVLEAGESASQATVTALLRRLLRWQVEQVEAAEVIEELPTWLADAGAGAAGAARTVAGAMDEEAVVRAYLTIAADTSPLPVVDALGATFPAHRVVVERLVDAVSERPELVTVGASLDGAPSWQTYERWLLG